MPAQVELDISTRETGKTKHFFFARNPSPYLIVKDKVLYVYLRITQTIVLTPMFVDKFAILYKPMEEWEVQDLTWHGFSIPKLAPKVTALTQPKGDVNGKGVIDGLVPNSSKVASSRARIGSSKRPPVPSASPVPLRDPFSPFSPIN